MKSVVRKTMTFPKQLVRLVEKNAKRLGFDFNEYTRMILAQQIINDSEEIEQLDEETERRVHEGIEDIKAGRYTVIKAGGQKEIK